MDTGVAEHGTFKQNTSLSEPVTLKLEWRAYPFTAPPPGHSDRDLTPDYAMNLLTPARTIWPAGTAIIIFGRELQSSLLIFPRHCCSSTHAVPQEDLLLHWALLVLGRPDRDITATLER